MLLSMRLSLLLFFLVPIPAFAVTPAIPFGSHTYAYAANVITPTNQTRAQMDLAVQNFYTTWKANYAIGGCVAGRRRINYDGANQTVSEAHGYGMLAAVLMAGYDADAQNFFDDQYRYFRAHPTLTHADLMAWQQNAACANINGADSASDGDLDIALALLMADRQWGSCGAINYKVEGLKVVTAIKAQELDLTKKYVLLGNWVNSGDTTYYPATRSSDFMVGHYKSFQWASGDSAWDGVRNHTYFIVTSVAHATTGLMPDFISNPATAPIVPVLANHAWCQTNPCFLENPTDDDHGYNGCRDPWRIGSDMVISGDPRAFAALLKINTFIRGAAAGNAANVKSGRTLAGVVQGNYEDMAFTAPYMIAAMSDSTNQAWLNSLWTRVAASTGGQYFDDSIKLICMVVASGNWWAPEQMPDPCAAPSATPTWTPTLTKTSTRTQSPSVTRSPSVTPFFTLSETPTPSATKTASPSPSASPSGSPSVSPSPTRTGTPSITASFSPTPVFSVTVSPTVSGTQSPSPFYSVTETPSLSATRTSSPSLTASPTGSPSDSSSITRTVTPSHSPTRTATPTRTSTATTTITFSATPTALLSSTSSTTPTETGTIFASPSCTETPAASATLTVIPSAPGRGRGRLQILAQAPVPNPNPRTLSVALDGDVDEVELRIYDVGMRCVAELRQGPLPMGWVSLSLPSEWLNQAANGIYYYRLRLKRDLESASGSINKLFVLR